MTVLHSAMTGTELHEPKGIDSATANQLYLADGAGTGTWTDVLGTLTAAGIYETDSWTPAATFVVPGDLSIAYSTQTGEYVKIADLVIASFSLTTSTFTHTTASGALRITGLPYTNGGTSLFNGYFRFWQGITKANYTAIHPFVVGGESYMQVSASGSAQTVATIAASDMPTAGTVSLRGQVIYVAA